MELIVILLSSISGALIGTSVGIYLLYRKLRPITGAELDLTRGKLRSTEFSLASATASLEKMKKQLEDRDAQFAAAEEKAREIETTLRQQVAEQDTKLNDEARAVAENATRQIASYETRIDNDERLIAELNARVSQISAELSQSTSELDQLRSHLNEETSGRSTLETQLSAEHDNTRRLASRIAELEAERSHFDITLQEERQSAARGIELLLMAQENLARVFKPAPAAEAVPANTNGHTLVAAAAGGSSAS